MKNPAVILSLVLMALFAQISTAAAQKWEIDTGHSNFYFSVDHIFSKIQGRFSGFSGEVFFDPQNLAESKMKFVIETKSIDTAITKRDKHLLSPDFFDAATYPTMEFISDSITASGENVFEIAGKFTVKGKAYDLVLPLTMVGVKDHPIEKDKQVAGFNGKLVLDRLAYMIGNGKFADAGVVGKDVEVFVTLELLSGK